MAAGNVGYTDTRSFSGSLLADIARSIRDRTKKAASMAREERAFAEDQAEKQDTSLDEAGIGKGYFFRRALGSTFGGDRIARTRGYFESNPPMGRDPLGSIESRFRGGFDYGIPEEELKKQTKLSSPSSRSSSGGTSVGGSGSPISASAKDKPLSVKHTRLTVGMLSTFQRLEKQLAGITDMIGSGSKDAQSVYALQNQKMLLGGVFAKTTNIINALTKAIDSQTSVIKKIADDEKVALDKETARINARNEELAAEQQDASFGNNIKDTLKRVNEKRKELLAPGSRLKDIIGPSSQIRNSLMRNPRAAMRLARMRAKRVLGKTITRGVSRPLGKVGGILAKKTLGKAVAKQAAKGIGKSLIKKVPILGAVAGVAFGIERAMKGDFVGALGEVASGVAGSFPGVGTAISTGIDAALVAKDVNEAMNQQEVPEFEDGGIIKGEDKLKSTLTKFENDKLKREIGAKPLDLNFWRDWHSHDVKADMKNKKELSKIAEMGADRYFYQKSGVEQFVDGMKWLFQQIKDLLMKVPGVPQALGWIARTGRTLRNLLGGGYEYTDPDTGIKLTKTSDYGLRKDPFTGQEKNHGGTDISTDSGTPLRAISDGEIVDSDSLGDKGWGNFLVYKDDQGIYHLYGHMLGGFKRSGKVKKGDIIGKVGSTGRSTGPHLHWETGTGWNKSNITGPFDPLSRYRMEQPFFTKREGAGADTPPASPSGRTPLVKGLGKQGVMSNKNFGSVAGVGKAGYLIVPGHASGGGAPGEKAMVKLLARNAYQNIKAKFPKANVQMQDVDGMFEDSEAGFAKQKEWYKKKEAEGWEILEIHMDASMESGSGLGRGVIVPVKELNSIEQHFAKNYGAFDRGFRDLAAPNRGASIFELGNMSPELQRAVTSNKVSKSQLDALTKPFENSVAAGLNLVPTGQQPGLNKGGGVTTQEAVWNIFLKGLQ